MSTGETVGSQVASPAPAVVTRPSAGQRLVYVIVCGGVLMAAVDLTIVNVALPSVGRALGGGLSNLSWVLNGYAIVYAALLIPAGRLADRGSRRAAFLAGVGIFVTGSALCAGAVSLPMLVAARVVQAAGAATLMPTSLSLMLASYGSEGRARAVRSWAAIAGIGAAIGPFLGGLLVTIDWRWIFLVNVPVGVVVVLAGRRSLPEARTAARGALPDIPGAVVLILAVSALSLVLVEGTSWGWASWRILLAAAVTVVALAAFVRRCARHPSPVISPGLMRLPGFLIANLAGLLYSASFAAAILSVSLWCQDVWGWSALITGLAMAPGNVLLPFVSAWSGTVAQRLGVVGTIAAGCCLLAGGTSWWILAVGERPDYLVALLPGVLLTRIGIGLALPSLVGAATIGLPPADLATGSAINNMLRQLGFSLGYSLFILFAGHYAAGHALPAFRSGWEFAAIAALLAAGAGATLVSRPGTRPPGSRPAAVRRSRDRALRADGDLGPVRVEGDVPGDLRHRGVGVLVAPDEVGLRAAVRGGDAVVAGVALVGAVGLGGGPLEQ